LSRQKTTTRTGRQATKAALLGAPRSDALALVHESGAHIVTDPAEADVIHLTDEASAAIAALPDVLGLAPCVVLHEWSGAAGAAELEDLAARAHDAGTVVAVPLVQRYYPMVRLARRRIRSGTPGPLHMLHGWAAPSALAAYCDLLEFVTGHLIERVVTTSVAATPWGSIDGRTEIPGARGLLFQTDRGAAGTLAISQARPVEGGTLLLALDGVDESVVFHEGRPEVLDAMGFRGTQRFQRGVGADVSRYSTQPAGRPQGYRDCWSSFVADAHAAVAGREPDGLPTLRDVARSARIEAAINVSDQTDGWAVVAHPELGALDLTEGKSA
jgi:predicted dehydrogenase